MQNQAVLLFALMGASAIAAAQGAPAPAANPAATGPSFSASDEIPSSQGFSDAYSLDEIKIGGAVLTEEQQISRWQAELNAGRARAGSLVGAYRTYRALSALDCTAARDNLTRADELGSDQAPWVLAKLAATDTCGPVDRPQRERWLKKAVTLDDPRALRELLLLYRNSTDTADRVPQYLYARVAAGYWDSVKLTQARDGFDAPALQELEKSISAADRSQAEADAAKILEQVLKRHQRFSVPKATEFMRSDAGSKGSIVGWQADYRHECQWNLKNNCRGTQRLIFVDLVNKNSEFLTCRLELRGRDFVSGELEAEPYTRRVLIGPQATRRLLLGDVYGEPDKKIVVAKCGVVPNLVANAAAGRCRAKLLGSIDVQSFYPDAARRQGIEGSTVVRYWIPPGTDEPTDAEIATSSGNVLLDDAAMATVRSGKFSHDCDYALSSIRIAFKLAELKCRRVFHIVIFEPEIPPNTGNLIRLSANTGCELHLIKPLGFRLDRKSVRRAGLDYDELATLQVHENFAAARAAIGGNWFAIETGAARRHIDVKYSAGDTLLFGSERRGLPPEVLREIEPQNVVSLPMRAGNRSLNLSNAAAVAIYEAWRQADFAGAG